MGEWRAPAAAMLLLLDVFGLTRPAHDWIPGSGLRPVDRLLLAATLLLLAHGLLGRRKLAQYAALALVVLAAAGPPLHPGRLVVLGSVVALLLPYGNRFVVRPDPQRLRTACAAALVAVLFVLGRGVWEAIGRAKPVREARVRRPAGSARRAGPVDPGLRRHRADHRPDRVRHRAGRRPRPAAVR